MAIDEGRKPNPLREFGEDHHYAEITVTFRDATREEVEAFKAAIMRAVYNEHLLHDVNNERIGYGVVISVVITEPGK